MRIRECTRVSWGKGRREARLREAALALFPEKEAVNDSQDPVQQSQNAGFILVKGWLVKGVETSISNKHVVVGSGESARFQ